MRLTQGAAGNLRSRYRAVLRRCALINVFGSLAVAALLAGAPAPALAEQIYNYREIDSEFSIRDNEISRFAEGILIRGSGIINNREADIILEGASRILDTGVLQVRGITLNGTLELEGSSPSTSLTGARMIAVGGDILVKEAGAISMKNSSLLAQNIGGNMSLAGSLNLRSGADRPGLIYCLAQETVPLQENYANVVGNTSDFASLFVERAGRIAVPADADGWLISRHASVAGLMDVQGTLHVAGVAASNDGMTIPQRVDAVDASHRWAVLRFGEGGRLLVHGGGTLDMVSGKGHLLVMTGGTVDVDEESQILGEALRMDGGSLKAPSLWVSTDSAELLSGIRVKKADMRGGEVTVDTLNLVGAPCEVSGGVLEVANTISLESVPDPLGMPCKSSLTIQDTADVRAKALSASGGMIRLEGGTLSVENMLADWNPSWLQLNGGELLARGGLDVSSLATSDEVKLNSSVLGSRLTTALLRAGEGNSLLLDNGRDIVFTGGAAEAFLQAREVTVRSSRLHLGQEGGSGGGGQTSAPVTVESAGRLTAHQGDWRLDSLHVGGTAGVDAGKLAVCSLDILESGTVQVGSGSTAAALEVETSLNNLGGVHKGIRINNLGTMLVANPDLLLVQEDGVYRKADTAGTIVGAEGSVLKLNFDASTLLTTEQERQIRTALGNDFSGVIDFGSAILGSAVQNGRIDYCYTTQDTSDAVKEAIVFNIPQDSALKGIYKGAELKENVDTLIVSGSLALRGDVQHDMPLIARTGADAGLGDALVRGGAVLTLGEAGEARKGSLGNVTLETRGTLNAVGAAGAAFTAQDVHADATGTKVNVDGAALNLKSVDASYISVNNGQLEAGAAGSDRTSAVLTSGTLSAVARENTSGDITLDTAILNNGSLRADNNVRIAHAVTATGSSSVKAGGNIEMESTDVTAEKDISLDAGGSIRVKTVEAGHATLKAGDTIVLNTLGLDEGRNGSASIVAKKIEGNDVRLHAGSDMAVREAVLTHLEATGSELRVGENADIATLSLSGSAMTVDGMLKSTEKATLHDGATLQAAGADLKELAIYGSGDAKATSAMVEDFSGRAATVFGNSRLILGTKDAGWLSDMEVPEDATTAAVLGIAQAQTLAGGSLLALHGGAREDWTAFAEETAGTTGAHFGGGSLLVVNAGALGANATALTVDGPASVRSDASGPARLHLGKARVGQSYRILAATPSQLTVDEGAWSGNALTLDSPLMQATLRQNMEEGLVSVDVSSIPSASIFPSLDTDMQAVIDEMVLRGMTDEDSANYGERYLNRAINRMSAGKAATTITGLMEHAVAGAVPQAMLGVAETTASAATARTSLAAPPHKGGMVALADDGSAHLEGISAGDGMKNGIGLWIMPVYQHQNRFDLGALDTGFKSSLGGVSLGADYTFRDALRLGVACNVGAGYASSYGDVQDTTNNFEYWGASLYAGYVYGDLGFTADIGYSGTRNKVKQDVPDVMGMAQLEGNIHARDISAGLRGEARLHAGGVDIVPHAGVRMHSLHWDSYDMDSAGATVTKNGSVDCAVWQFPVGVSLSREFGENAAWKARPQVDLTVVPVAGDRKVRQDIRIPGLASAAEMDCTVMDALSARASLGVEVKHEGGFSALVNYSFQGGAHSADHGVNAGIRFEF
ncbi:MAG: autotransporter outer membrane beta-barrel domain-containing protein [Desulfovibrionaceae bacterium]|nr:autotransporter outer membrane beta-barrel domain-containing protein [Desulfovibrionaceae bacterium]